MRNENTKLFYDFHYERNRDERQRACVRRNIARKYYILARCHKQYHEIKILNTTKKEESLLFSYRNERTFFPAVNIFFDGLKIKCHIEIENNVRMKIEIAEIQLQNCMIGVIDFLFS